MREHAEPRIAPGPQPPPEPLPGNKPAASACSGRTARRTPGSPRIRRHFTSEVDYEQLLLKRNAPRWLRKLKQNGFLDQPAAPAAAVA